MASIAFIINPISGSGKAGRLIPVIEKMASGYSLDIEIHISRHPGHAAELAADCAARGVGIAVAVGGDGTVHEVASALVGTQCALGMIPCGSGNGLAGYVGIPHKPRRALQQLFRAVADNTGFRTIDTCTINGQPFFCTAGVGFDAQVGMAFSTSGHRGLWSYIVSMVKEFRTFSPTEYEILTDGERRRVSAFLITFANAGEWGNNAFIAPKAAIDDGFIDVIIITPLRIWSTPLFLLQLITKRLGHNSHFTCIRCRSAHIVRPSEGVIHFDGEPAMSGKTISVGIQPGSLKIIA